MIYSINYGVIGWTVQENPRRLILSGRLTISDITTQRTQEALWQGVTIQATPIVGIVQEGTTAERIPAPPLSPATASVGSNGAFTLPMAFNGGELSGRGAVRVTVPRNGEVVIAPATRGLRLDGSTNGQFTFAYNFGAASDPSQVVVTWSFSGAETGGGTTPSTGTGTGSTPGTTGGTSTGATATNATDLTWPQAELLGERGYSVECGDMPDRRFFHRNAQWVMDLLNPTTGALIRRGTVQGGIDPAAPEFREEDFRRTNWRAVGSVADADLAAARAVAARYP
jgi:hypothetical protein